MEQLTSLRTTELKFSVQPSAGAAQPRCSGGPALPAPVRRVCHLAGLSNHKAHVRPEESTATRDLFAKSVTSTPLLVEPSSVRECIRRNCVNSGRDTCRGRYLEVGSDMPCARLGELPRTCSLSCKHKSTELPLHSTQSSQKCDHGSSHARRSIPRLRNRFDTDVHDFPAVPIKSRVPGTEPLADTRQPRATTHSAETYPIHLDRSAANLGNDQVMDARGSMLCGSTGGFPFGSRGNFDTADDRPVLPVQTDLEPASIQGLRTHVDRFLRPLPEVDFVEPHP